MSHSNQILTISPEKAFEIISELDGVDRHNSDGADVWRGKHPQHGNCVVIIPALGDAVYVPTPRELQPPVTLIKNATL